jgi:hypothetical protein
MLVALLDQQPSFPAALVLADAGKRPAAAQLLAAQLHDEVTLVERALERHLAPVALRAVAIGPGIPHDHRAGAVLALGDDALKPGVLERMILDANRKPLHARIRRRTLGYGPRLQHTPHLQPEVVVVAARRMLLHDEHRSAPRALAPARRLRTAAEVALGQVVRDRHRASRL